jgi:hypothetical protein
MANMTMDRALARRVIAIDSAPCRLIADVLDVPINRFTDEVRLAADLDPESLGTVISAVGHEYAIRFTNRQTSQLRSIADVLQIVDSIDFDGLEYVAGA